MAYYPKHPPGHRDAFVATREVLSGKVYMWYVDKEKRQVIVWPIKGTAVTVKDPEPEHFPSDMFIAKLMLAFG